MLWRPLWLSNCATTCFRSDRMTKNLHLQCCQVSICEVDKVGIPRSLVHTNAQILKKPATMLASSVSRRSKSQVPSLVCGEGRRVARIQITVRSLVRPQRLRDVVTPAGE